MAVNRQWVVDTLRRLGYSWQAEEALRVLPDPVDLQQVQNAGDRSADVGRIRELDVHRDHHLPEDGAQPAWPCCWPGAATANARQIAAGASVHRYDERR